MLEIGKKLKELRESKKHFARTTCQNVRGC